MLSKVSVHFARQWSSTCQQLSRGRHGAGPKCCQELGCIIVIIISISISIISIIVQKVHYEQTKNIFHCKIVQCIKDMEQLCKVLKLYH